MLSQCVAASSVAFVDSSPELPNIWFCGFVSWSWPRKVPTLPANRPVLPGRMVCSRHSAMCFFLSK